MKRLYDRNQHQQLIRLFDDLVKHETTKEIPKQALLKVLQSGAKLQDLSCALRIQNAIPSRHTNDPYIMSSLVHMFSK